VTTEPARIEACDGYQRLLVAVERDEVQSPKFHDYRGKLTWVIARANNYAEKTGIPAPDILDAWENGRDYWYMNYYQESNQPQIGGERVRVFDTVREMLASIGEPAFRCPMCNGISKSPYECSVAPCDWKVYGLFRDCGKGIYVFVKEKVRGELMFMPIAWEKQPLKDVAP
jgi:hypothetical protein